MSDTTPDLKACCAGFYQSHVARLLLGESFHPGGLDLTLHLGQAVGLGPEDKGLDVACGRGLSALHLAQEFGCHITGLDYGAENVTAAQARVAEMGFSERVVFRQGDAEALPFPDETFSVVISECSFCTFPDKATAASEMARVLQPGGRLGLTDMTVSGPLPDDLQGLLSWVACVAGAGTLDDYVSALRGAGLGSFHVEDQRGALLRMVGDVRRKLLGVELAVKLGKLDLGDIDLTEGKRLARRAVEIIEQGLVGYTLITGIRE
jgi:arsenite methyltransferase